MKTNCWELKNCGREAGGTHAKDEGVCPAYTEDKLNGVHDGKNGGRACWMVAGTFCGGKVQGTFADKASSCMNCDFYKSVHEEEDDDFLSAGQLLRRMAA